MVTAVEVIQSRGVQNADSIVRAAAELKLPVHIAAALIEKESNGANVYGDDRPRTVFNKLDGARPAGGVVTEQNFIQFERRVANGETPNGVGPSQITYFTYFPAARDQGVKLWEPYDNIKFGLRILAGSLGENYSSASVRAAGTSYNGDASYGVELAQRVERWANYLNGATADVPASAPARTAALLATVH